MHFVFMWNFLFQSHHQWNPPFLNQKSFGSHYCCCTLGVLSYSSHFITKAAKELLMIPSFSCIQTRTLYHAFSLIFRKQANFAFNRKLTLCISYISSPVLSTNLAHLLHKSLFQIKSLQDNCESPLVTLSQLLLVMFNYFCSKIYTIGNQTETPDLKIWHFYQGENIMK